MIKQQAFGDANERRPTNSQFDLRNEWTTAGEVDKSEQL